MRVGWRKYQTIKDNGLKGSNNYNNNKQLSQLYSLIPSFLTILFLDSAISRIRVRLYMTRQRG